MHNSNVGYIGSQEVEQRAEFMMHNPVEVDLKAYIYLIRSWLWLIVLSALVAGATAWLVSVMLTPTYEATTLLLVQSDSTDAFEGTLANQRVAETYAQLLERTSLLEDTLGQLGLEAATVEPFIDVQVISVRSTPLVELRVEGPDPVLIAAIANKMPEVFDQKMWSRPDIQSVDMAVIAEPAKVPVEPTGPRTLINTLLATIVGIMLALGSIFLIEYLDDRVQTAEDLKRIANVPVLGAIAHTLNGETASGRNLISVTEPRNPIVEAYRGLRTNLQFYNIDATIRSLALTSSAPAEGKSTTASNLAVVMAQSGKSVILVDADLRKPKLHITFGNNQQPGLTEALLANEVPASSLLKPVPQVPNLRLLTAGASAPNPAELLGSNRMQQLLEELHECADIVLFDLPPVLAVTDALILGRLTDGAILVINAQETTGTAVYRSLEIFHQANVPLLGAVLNRVTQTMRNGYYSYNYNYYADDRAESTVGIQNESRWWEGMKPAAKSA